MENRIKKLFSKRNGDVLSVFYTAGFPELTSTGGIALSLQESGADIIEIGIPFSDPVADGPTIQDSNKIALENGMNVKLLLSQVKDIRKNGLTVPLILMGYLNPIMQYGVEQFVKDAAEAGVDGLILPDMPLHEYEEHYKTLFRESNLCSTFLISPTTSGERIRRIDAITDGFIYAVSASSITGAKGKFSEEQITYFSKLKEMKLKNPVLIGFGISNHETFSTAAGYADGAIVGSAFIELLKKSTDNKKDIKDFVQKLKGQNGKKRK
jgi:tryptophan synthase alpha chain